MPKAPVRADHVGSLLRPADLWQEMRRVYAPGHTSLLAEERAKNLDRLHELQDRCVAEAVARRSTSASTRSRTASCGGT